MTKTSKRISKENYSKLLIISIDYILNKINNFNLIYFESSRTFISTSTNRIFNLHSINTISKTFEIFDKFHRKNGFCVEKIDSIFI